MRSVIVSNEKLPSHLARVFASKVSLFYIDHITKGAGADKSIARPNVSRIRQ